MADEDLRALERRANAGDAEPARRLRRHLERVHGRKRGIQILFATYWSSKGWNESPSTPPEDFALARALGLMFERRSLDHRATVAWARKSVASLSPAEVGDAFLVSLSTRRLELRSALGSFAVGRFLEDHEFRGRHSCATCQAFEEDELADLNVLNFERFKWGGVRHTEPLYMGFDLEQLSLEDRHEPAPEDVTILERILRAAEGLGSNAHPARLEAALKGVLASNKEERKTLVTILGLAGILGDEETPAFFDHFVDAEQRPRRTEWIYPISMWTGGVRTDVIEFYFGHRVSVKRIGRGGPLRLEPKD